MIYGNVYTKECKKNYINFLDMAVPWISSHTNGPYIIHRP